MRAVRRSKMVSTSKVLLWRLLSQDSSSRQCSTVWTMNRSVHQFSRTATQNPNHRTASPAKSANQRPQTCQKSRKAPSTTRNKRPNTSIASTNHKSRSNTQLEATQLLKIFWIKQDTMGCKIKATIRKTGLTIPSSLNGLIMAKRTKLRC